MRTPVAVTEVAPWGSSDPTYADWWELTNNTGATIDLTGWKMDDESSSFASAVALNGVSTLAPGKSAIFVEGDATKATAFTTFWFGGSVPAGFNRHLQRLRRRTQLQRRRGQRLQRRRRSPDRRQLRLLDDQLLLRQRGRPRQHDAAAATISTLSVAGVNGVQSGGETGSPGTIVSPPPVGPLLSTDTPAFPPQAVGTIGPGQWVTVTDSGDADVQITRVAIEEANEESAGDFLLSADHCTGETLAPGDTCRVQVRFAPGRETRARAPVWRSARTCPTARRSCR